VLASRGLRCAAARRPSRSELCYVGCDGGSDAGVGFDRYGDIGGSSIESSHR
jgi:hypothetical protein